jgi:hypothetical protein
VPATPAEKVYSVRQSGQQSRLEGLRRVAIRPTTAQRFPPFQAEAFEDEPPG